MAIWKIHIFTNLIIWPALPQWQWPWYIYTYVHMFFNVKINFASYVRTNYWVPYPSYNGSPPLLVCPLLKNNWARNIIYVSRYTGIEAWVRFFHNWYTYVCQYIWKDKLTRELTLSLCGTCVHAVDIWFVSGSICLVLWIRTYMIRFRPLLLIGWKIKMCS